MSDELIQEFLMSITGQGTDYSRGRTEHANEVLKDFMDNLENVNNLKDIDAVTMYKDTLNPYFPEYRSVRSRMDSEINEKRLQYNEYEKGLAIARSLIEDKDNKWGTRVWLEGDPDAIFEATNSWTMKDVTRVSNEIRRAKSLLSFGLPSDQSDYGQNFTSGRPGDKVLIDRFNQLEETFNIVLRDASQSKKHTFMATSSSNGLKLPAVGKNGKGNVMIPLLTMDNIRLILAGDMERYQEVVDENKELLQKNFYDNVSTINKLDNLIITLAKKKVINNDGEEQQFGYVADDFLTVKLNSEIPMEKEIASEVMEIAGSDGPISIEQVQDVVEYIEGKIRGLRNSNDALNYAHLKWSTEPIYSIKEQIYSFEGKGVDEKGFFETYNLGLYDTEGNRVPDQVIFEDTQAKIDEELDAMKGAFLNQGGKQ